MYPSPLAKSTVTDYCDIWWIKKPIHIITCSSCTCAPLYVNILSFNSQPVLLKGFGSFTRVTFLPTLLTRTFVLLFYLLFKFTSKVLFVGRKTRRPFGHLHAKIVIVGSSKWVKNHHFCAQLSHCFGVY